MNDEPLPEVYGAPLRLRVENQLGYKMVKWIERIEFIEVRETARQRRRREERRRRVLRSASEYLNVPLCCSIITPLREEVALPQQGLRVQT